jgi:hypothetical protein
MDELLLKNISSTELNVQDLGIQIDPGIAIDLNQNYKEEELLESVDLWAVFGQGQVVLNGIQITSQNLRDYLTPLDHYDKLDYAYITSKDPTAPDVTGAALERLVNDSDASVAPELHHHDARYYSKTQLSTSGQASIDYSNLVNIPDFYWKSPIATLTNLPITPVVGDTYLIESLNQIYTWNGTTWINLSSAANISTSIIGYTATDVQNILQAIKNELTAIENGSTHIKKSLDDAYEDGSVITIDTTDLDINLTTPRTFAINSSIDNSVLLSVSNSTIVLNSKGTLTLQDANMTSSISLSQNGQGGLVGFTATSIIGALNELKNEETTMNVSLQSAYNGGKTINVNASAIQLTYSSYAPLQFSNVSTSPTMGLADGQIAVIQGDLCVFDSSRMKWLSVTEIPYLWSDQA